MSIREYLTTETTIIEYKQELNFPSEKNPAALSKIQNWLKTISAFANTKGGTLLVGITDDKELIGIKDIKYTLEKTAETINAHISPCPIYELNSIRENNKDFLAIYVHEGRTTPYYYTDKKSQIAYIRAGDKSIAAPPQMLNSLILKGQNCTFDELPTQYTLDSVSFTYLNSVFKEKINDELKLPRDLPSFGLITSTGQITYAGALLCDQKVVPQSRIVCTAWNGLSKGSLNDDARDDKEYTGNLLQLLENAELFIQNNTKKSWKISGMNREEEEEYPTSSIREVIINALIHRDYTIRGSEIHIDLFPDRMEIVSPGGMLDGTKIQTRDVLSIPSMRRNEVISDIFGRLRLMDRRGSGFGRILQGYKNDLSQPKFDSDVSYFRVILPNKRYVSEKIVLALASLSDDDKALLQYLTKNKYITIKELADKMCVSERKVRYSIQKLKKLGIVERIGSNRTGFWIVHQ